MTRRWPVLELHPGPDLWAQFSDDDLRRLLSRRTGVNLHLIEPLSRGQLLLNIQSASVSPKPPNP